MSHPPHSFKVQLAQSANEVHDFIKHYLDQYSGIPSPLLQAIEYSVLGSGKRIRSFLLREVASFLDFPDLCAMPIAAATELIHEYSLIHDDLPSMDNATLRRGKPCVHMAFDEATAILVGDALIPMAFELIATHPDLDPVPASKKLEVCALLAQAIGAGGMVGGQALDMTTNLYSDPQIEQLIHLQNMKTGALIQFCLTAPTAIAKCTEQEKRALETFGKAFGMAFQISDDLLDLKTASETGKEGPSHTGKLTWLTLVGEQAAREALNTHVDQAIQALEPFGERATRLEEIANWCLTRVL